MVGSALFDESDGMRRTWLDGWTRLPLALVLGVLDGGACCSYEDAEEADGDKTVGAALGPLWPLKTSGSDDMRGRLALGPLGLREGRSSDSTREPSR